MTTGVIDENRFDRAADILLMLAIPAMILTKRSSAKIKLVGYALTITILSPLLVVGVAGFFFGFMPYILCISDQ